MTSTITESEFKLRMNDRLDESVNDFIQQVKYVLHIPNPEAPDVTKAMYTMYGLLREIGMNLVDVVILCLKNGKRLLKLLLGIKMDVVSIDGNTDGVTISKKLAVIVADYSLLIVFAFAFVATFIFVPLHEINTQIKKEIEQFGDILLEKGSYADIKIIRIIVSFLTLIGFVQLAASITLVILAVVMVLSKYLAVILVRFRDMVERTDTTVTASPHSGLRLN